MSNIKPDTTFTTSVLIADTYNAPNGSSDSISSLTKVGEETVSAALEIQSTNGGLLIPRMTTEQINDLTVTDGMIVYDTTLHFFKMYQNGGWSPVGDGNVVGPTGAVTVGNIPIFVGGTGTQIADSFVQILQVSPPPLSKSKAVNTNVNEISNLGWVKFVGGAGGIYVDSLSPVCFFESGDLISSVFTDGVPADCASSVSALVELNSSTGALLISRMHTSERTALTAVNGMIVYDKDINAFYVYQGGIWVPVDTAGGTVTQINAGTGITCSPNPIVGVGTISITNTGVTAGTYSFPINMTINAQGQVTEITSDGFDDGSNIFVGKDSGISGLIGSNNSGFGINCLNNNFYGVNNCAFGYDSMQNNNEGGDNCAFGYSSLYNNNDGSYNCGFGINVLYQNVSGSGNSVFGMNAATQLENYNNCSFFGYQSDATVDGLSNSGAIGANSTVSVNNALVLGSGCYVGIGTSSPAYTLDLGNINSQCGIQLAESTSQPATPSGTSIVLFNNAGTLSYIGTSAVVNELVTNVLGTSGQIASSGGITPTISLDDNPIIPGAASLTIPIGNTADRPSSPTNGMIRYNSQTGYFEVYNGSWVNINTAGGTVTSVAIATSGSGWSAVTGSPITTSGTITLSLNSGLQDLSSYTHNSFLQVVNQTITQYDVLVGGSSNNITSVGPGTSGQLLQSGGSSANPSYTSTPSGLTSIGVGNISISGNTISSTNLNGVIILAPNGTGEIQHNNNINIQSQNLLKFYNSANTFYAALKAPSLSSNVSWTLPSTDSANFLASNGSGVLSFSSAVTSVAVSGSNGLTVSGSPITTSGTITLTLGAELQALSGLSTTGYIKRVGTATYATINPIPVTDGGTNATSFTAYGVVCGGTTSTGTLQSLSSLGTTGQLLTSNGTGVLPSFQTYTGSSSVVTLGTITSGTWNGSIITGTYGGTGVNNGIKTITLGGNLVTSGSSSLTLTTTGTTNVTLPTSGTLVAGTVTQYNVLVGGASSTIASIGPGTAGQVLQSGGSSANPAYSTATYPTTTTANQILYSSSANTIGGLATGSNQILATNGSGVPSFQSFFIDSGVTNANLFLGTNCANNSNTGGANTGFGYYCLNTINASSNSNSAFGSYALSAITTGNFNSAFGAVSLQANQTGDSNCAFGEACLGYTTSSQNSGFGTSSLLNNTTGQNDAFGYRSLYTNTTGTSNSAFGYQSLFSNQTNNYNCAFGYQSLYSSTADTNAAFGYKSLYANTSGTGNSAFGFEALQNSTTISGSSAFGYKALTSATGTGNSAFGYQCMSTVTNGTYNCAFGTTVLSSLTTGGSNCAFGNSALTAVTTTGNNCAFGVGSLYGMTGSNNSGFGDNTFRNATSSTSNNTAAGYQAGSSQLSYTNCTFLGANADASVNNLTNATAIGYNASVAASNSMILGNGANVGIGTSSPTQILHVSSNVVFGLGATFYIENQAGGTGAEVRIDASTYASSSWSTSPPARIRFVDNGDYSANIFFQTKIPSSGSSAAAATRLYIASGGNVGIGTTSPTFLLQLNTDSAAKPSTSSWTVASDGRIKEKISEYKKGLTEILKIRPIIYRYNKNYINEYCEECCDTDEHNKLQKELTIDRIGIIAQEIEEFIPECIKKKKSKNFEDFRYFNIDPIFYMIINAIKELKHEIELLKNT